MSWIGLMVLALECVAVAHGEDLPSAQWYQSADMPPLVHEMANGPTDGALRQRIVLDANTSGHLGLVQSIEWIEKVIAPDWLPNDSGRLKANMTLIPNEYMRKSGKRTIAQSATHVSWKTNAWTFSVSQTNDVMVIVLTPTREADPAKTNAAMKQYAQKAVAVFQDEAVLDPGRKFRQNRLRHHIAERSFNCGFIRNGNGWTSGQAWSREMARDALRTMKSGDTAPPEPNFVNVEVAEGSGNTYTMKSIPKWWQSYWWEFVGWSTDGRMVIFWTTKRWEDAQFGADKWF